MNQSKLRLGRIDSALLCSPFCQIKCEIILCTFQAINTSENCIFEFSSLIVIAISLCALQRDVCCIR
jgi:hypothetical protein